MNLYFSPEPEAKKKGTLASPAMALASRVLPKKGNEID